MYSDGDGHSPIGFFTQLLVSVYSYFGMLITSIWDEEVRKDMKRIKWNPFNSSEELASKSEKVTWYKGVPVYRVDGNSSSFCAIFLTKYEFQGSSGHIWTQEETLRHEWGHSVQQLLYGPIMYLLRIGIPSAFIDNDDNTPWEITADLIGGVNRPYNEDHVNKGWQYFKIIMSYKIYFL